MTKLIIQLLLILTISIDIVGQEFVTTFYLSNDLGELDSVSVGYDPYAEEGIDTSLGEFDISQVHFEPFDIRTGQIHVDQVIFQQTVLQLTDLAQYLGDIEIVPKECFEFIPVSNQAGFTPTINLFIKTDEYPVHITWNRQAFDDDCVGKSFLTDWPATSWWDIPCCMNLEIDEMSLADNDSVTINRQLGLKVVCQAGDTLTMLTILLADNLWSNVSDPQESIFPIVYPNPSNGVLFLDEGWDVVNVINIAGQPVDFTSDNKHLVTSTNGVLLISLRRDDEIVVLKQINNVR